jgi:hypothetical protein
MCSRRRMVLAAVFAAVVAGVPVGVQSPKFLPDDPLQVDDDKSIDASKVTPIEGSNGFDFAQHTFGHPGDRRSIRAVNVNTADEVPDSSWFTNRIGRRQMSLEEIARGPNQLETINIDGWPIVQEKSSGITPGYRVTDPTGHLYQVKFDPPEHPEMASSAEVIGAAFYHAAGYNVVQGYAVDVDPDRIVISPKATTVDLSGNRRAMRREDVDRLLARAARLPNGKYRATLSRFAEGRPVGYFKYYGTRPDDPNDIHPHEHRRELRANRVFAAWLNHDDSRGINTLDMLDGPDGRKHIVHYMFDFGSIMGSGSTIAQVPRAGNEYILEWGPAFKTLLSLGLYVRPWILVDYDERAKAVGRFEGDFFDAVKWRPEYPNPAFDNMRADDAFWAARLVAKFSDEAIRAVVAKARYTEPGAAELIASTLIKRRDKVMRAWLTGVNPITEPALAGDGTLTFVNAAASAGVVPPMASYVLRWSGLNNATGEATGQRQEQTVEATGSRVSQKAPDGVLSATAGYVQVAVETTAAGFPAWRLPVTLTFRRVGDRWQHVGLERTLTQR